jgi:hypothetical protein
VTLRSRQAALVAGQHAPKDRYRTFLRLRVRTAEADQSLRTMLASCKTRVETIDRKSANAAFILEFRECPEKIRAAAFRLYPERLLISA